MSEDERAIRRLIQEWIEASTRGELDKVLALMSDDVLFMVPGREPFGKDEFTRASEGMKGVKMEGVSDVKEVLVAGELAYTRTHLTITVSPPSGEPVRRAGYTLSVWRKQAGRWLLTRDANLLAVQ